MQNHTNPLRLFYNNLMVSNIQDHCQERVCVYHFENYIVKLLQVVQQDVVTLRDTYSSFQQHATLFHPFQCYPAFESVEDAWQILSNHFL